jgi:hypothetical protein
VSDTTAPLLWAQADGIALDALRADQDVIRAYAGEHLTRLYLRRTKYMEGSRLETLIEQENRELQQMTARTGAHINFEPLRSDSPRHLDTMSVKKIGEITLLATVTDHSEGVLPPRSTGPGSTGSCTRPWGVALARSTHRTNRPFRPGPFRQAARHR